MQNICNDTFLDIEYILAKASDNELNLLHRILFSLWLLPLLVIRMFMTVLEFAFFCIWVCLLGPVWKKVIMMIFRKHE